MPQTNLEIAEYNLREDMRSYYRGSVVTFVPQATEDGVEPLPYAALVEDFRGANNELFADVRLLPRGEGGWGPSKRVPVAALAFTLPPLGLVAYQGHWFHLSRQPARRMRKGYHQETITCTPIAGHYRDHPETMSSDIVRQVWYGNVDRISTNIVVHGDGVFYATDKVASLDPEGNVAFIPNKEKLGEFVCKALANNWELATSKYSVRTLPSSAQMPLV